MNSFEQNIETWFAINGKARIRLEKQWDSQNKCEQRIVIVEWHNPGPNAGPPGQEDWSKATWDLLVSSTGSSWKEAFENLKSK